MSFKPKSKNGFVSLNKQKGHILFCTQTAYVGGGVEEWLWQLSSELEKKGWRITVGLAQGFQHHNPKKFLELYPFENSIFLDGRSGYSEQRRNSLIQAFSRVDPDIIVPVQLADALYVAAEWKHRRDKARLLTCLHGQFEGVIQDQKMLSNHIDMAVSVSRLGCNYLKAPAGLPQERVAHIPTGVANPFEIRSPFSRPKAVAYIGRLDQKEKRARDLIALLRYLGDAPDCVVHVVGDGPEREFIENSLAEVARTGQILFHGWLSRETIWRDIYPNIRGLLIFSPAEGGPIVAWEALINGVVPVTSNFVGRSEEGVLQDNVNSLVFPVGDVYMAAQHVKRLMSDAEYSPLFEAAVHIDSKYTLSGFSENWDTCFTKALHLPSRFGGGRICIPESSGRLSRLPIPPAAMYKLRLLYGRKFLHVDPGGEWPHTYGTIADRSNK